MKRLLPLATLLSFSVLLPLTAEEKGPVPVKPLAGVTPEAFPGVAHVVIKGEDPQIVYIPIIHDNPEHRVAGEKTILTIEENLTGCRKIAEQLFEEYGVRNVLLEGIGTELAGKYNAPDYQGRKLSVGTNKSIVFKTWFDLLNNHRWHLVPAFEKHTYGPLTLLGSGYNKRIQVALGEAKSKGWFQSREKFVANQDEFTKHIARACEGYNEKLDALLKEDPGLRREYDITVTQRNAVFIENTLKAEGPGVILCGGGHVQDLIDQFDKRELPYVILVPEGTAWPPPAKDEKKIYADMLGLGCQLKTCTLQFGDGTAAKVHMPIN